MSQETVAQLETALVNLKARLFDTEETVRQSQANLQTLQQYLSQIVELLQVPVSDQGVVNIEDILESIRAIRANVVATVDENSLSLEEVVSETAEVAE